MRFWPLYFHVCNSPSILVGGTAGCAYTNLVEGLDKTIKGKHIAMKLKLIALVATIAIGFAASAVAPVSASTQEVQPFYDQLWAAYHNGGGN